MGLVFMFYSYPRQILIAPPRCSPNTRPDKGDCVFGEQQGGNAETLSRIGADHAN